MAREKSDQKTPLDQIGETLRSTVTAVQGIFEPEGEKGRSSSRRSRRGPRAAGKRTSRARRKRATTGGRGRQQTRARKRVTGTRKRKTRRRKAG